MYKKRPEILAPAGDRERFSAALLYGADAVYLAGRRFGMRAASPNFSEEELHEAVVLAHANNVRVYVTCNVLPREGELEELPRYLAFLQEIGVDAAIIADVGVMALARQVAPRLPLHVSTQLGVTNSAAARALYEQGASRVVLARELSLAEIAAIRRNCPENLELEAFVHGAMCMAWSGRCMLSAYLTGRDGSHGDCAQPCRWAYDLTEPKRPGRIYGVEEDATGTYLFNANDLCMIDHVAALAEAGIASFKIEGRAKAAYYTAITTNAYRMAVDGYAASGFSANYQPEPWLRAELDTVSHRPYGTGFYFGAPAQNTKAGGYLRPWEAVAVVEEYDNGWLHVTERNRFVAGESCQIVKPGCRPVDWRIPEEMRSREGQIAVAPHPMMDVWLPFDRPLPPGTWIRRQRREEQA